MLRKTYVYILSVVCIIQMIPTRSSAIVVSLLECDTADPEICKNEFAQLFKENFQNCIHEYIEQVSKACMRLFDAEMIEFLTGSDVYTRMFYQQPFTNCSDFAKKHITAKDNGRLMAIFRDVVRYNVPTKSTLPSDIVQRIQQVNTDIDFAYANFFANIRNFWVEQYLAIRPQDLIAYPEYFRLDAYIRMMPAENIPRKYEILNEALRFLGFRNWFNFYEN